MTVLPDEVFVVFQGDERPRLADVIQQGYPLVTVGCIPRRGAAAARNAGAAWTGADLLAFVDDDCTVHPAWLQCYLRHFADDPILAAAGGSVVPVSSQVEAFTLGLQLDCQPHLYTRVRNPVGTIDRSGNLCVRAPVFRELGGFDEGLGAGTAFPAAEDTDFVYRALRRGLRLRYVPDAVVYHEQWRSRDEAARVEQGYGFGLGAFLITHVRQGDVYAAGLILRIAWHLGLRPMAAGLLRRRWERFHSGWRYLRMLPWGMIKGARRMPIYLDPSRSSDALTAVRGRQTVKDGEDTVTLGRQAATAQGSTMSPK
jgi:GT2 family glycosyltransferase